MNMKTTRKRIRRDGIRKSKRALPHGNGRQALLDAAARLFSTRGFAATSIRDIASEVGMLPGSVYYHFRSKEEIALTVHAAGVDHIRNAVAAELKNAPADPWGQLQAACVGHLNALLDGTDYAQVVTPHFARVLPAKLQSRLIAQRDDYEKLMHDLVAKLPLLSHVDRRYLRLALLGALNWVLTWYHPEGAAPATIAQKILDCFRYQLDANAR